VWSAVVKADVQGDTSFLEDARRRVSAEPVTAELVEMLVRRKRELFARDTRIMMVDRITRTAERLDIKVSWSPTK
jgi:hypothetical protein